MLMLRLASREVNTETVEAVKAISKFIAMLAGYFRLDDEDRLFKDDEDSAG